MQWLDRIPLAALVIATVLLGPAPFVPEPHLWGKLKMLAAAHLRPDLNKKVIKCCGT